MWGVPELQRHPSPKALKALPPRGGADWRPGVEGGDKLPAAALALPCTRGSPSQRSERNLQDITFPFCPAAGRQCLA